MHSDTLGNYKNAFLSVPVSCTSCALYPSQHQHCKAYRHALDLLEPHASNQHHPVQLLAAEQVGLGSPCVSRQQVSGAAALLACRLSSCAGQQK